MIEDKLENIKNQLTQGFININNHLDKLNNSLDEYEYTQDKGFEKLNSLLEEGLKEVKNIINFEQKK